MFCTTCRGPLDPNPHQGWYRCTRCGAWNAAAPQAYGAPPAYGAPQAQAAPPAYGAPQAYGAPSACGAPPAFAPPMMDGVALVADTDPSRVPPPPRQATPNARKLVFAYQGSQAISRVTGIAFSLALFPVLIPAFGIPGEVALLVSATPGTGTVTRVALDPSHRINKRPATKVEFSYTAEGQKYEESYHTLSAGGLQAGATISIEYASLYPGFGRRKGESYSFFGFASLWFLAMPLVGFVLLFTAWRSNRREIRAYVRGIATVGLITERTFGNSKQGNRRPRIIRWSFQVGPDTFTGSISHINHYLIDTLLPGPNVVVLYDPNNPSVNTVWVG